MSAHIIDGNALAQHWREQVARDCVDLQARGVKPGLAVLLVEQNVGQSLEIADRAYVMENGAIRFSGKPAELLASDTLRQAYLGM